MKRFVWLLWWYAMSWGAYAQTFALEIHVLKDQKPAADVRVEIKETAQYAFTDKEGKVIFRLPAGTYTIITEKDGQKAVRQIRLSGPLSVTLTLEKVQQLDEVVITTVLADDKTPVTVSELDKESIEKKYTAADVPYVLDEIPSVVSYSDPGHGVGYSGLRIRGIGPHQINVTLNGIPLNDPESQAVYWVDIPDFVSTTEKIQVQRGIGTSTYGTGAFGANIHLFTETPSDTAFAFLSAAAGSYNTSRLTFKAATGKLNDRLSVLARASKIYSDGYIDRAFADMKSYFISSLLETGDHTWQFIHFGGHERTYQAWYGVDKETFETDPTFNYAGAIYDENGNIIGFYDNEVDDYTQKHYQLHHVWQAADNVKLQSAAFYVRGYGYYEQYKQDQDFADYGFTPITIGGVTIDRTDLIRRKWLDNDFYGISLNVDARTDKHHWQAGAGLNRYIGLHYGEVIWSRFADDTEIRHRYYENTGDKITANFFIRDNYRLADRWWIYSDMQLRKIDYSIDYNPEKTFDPDEQIRLTDRLFFVNPKFGLWHDHGPWQWYLSAGRTNREPNRTDYVESSVKPEPETLYDLETGWQWRNDRISLRTSLYYMYYINQLVYTGRIDDVGNPIRENVGRSYRAGWENEWKYSLKTAYVKAFFTLSTNKNIDYTAWDGNELKNFGNTDIAYSPSFVGGLKAGWHPVKGGEIYALLKHVGKQYMDNRNIPQSELPAYTVVNAGGYYEWRNLSVTDMVRVQWQVNNLFDVKYAANGYMWGDTPYYFPQAGRHFLIGLQLAF